MLATERDPLLISLPQMNPAAIEAFDRAAVADPSFSLAPDRGGQVRKRLAAGAKQIRTSGPTLKRASSSELAI
jgi:hypothetical protein